MSIQQDIATLAQAFGNVDRMDPSGPIYRGICAILDRADDEALKAAHAANIKFVSNLAFNRMVRRGIARTVTVAAVVSGLRFNRDGRDYETVRPSTKGANCWLVRDIATGELVRMTEKKIARLGE